MSRISAHLRSINYLNVSAVDNLIRDIDFLPLGNLLRQNILSERMAEKAVLGESFSHSSFPEQYLALSTNWKQKKNSVQLVQLTNFQQSLGEDHSLGYSLDSCDVITSTSIVRPKNAFEMFHKMQRQRKIWWMKFVYNPGEVLLENPQRNERSQTISINLHSALGFKIELERIGLYNSGEKSNILLSSMPLQPAVLSLLIAALPDLTSDDLTMYLHRRLTPYKIALFAEDNLAKNRDIVDLAKLISYDLSKETNLNSLNSVLSNEKEKQSLESKLLHADRIGIPYSLVLSEESLSTGLLKMRSSNTTLSEEVHVTDIIEYVQQIIET